MSYTNDQVRELLAQNEAMRRKADESGERIRRSAEMELAKLDTRLNALRGPAHAGSLVAHEYQELVMRRGQLLNLVA